MNTNIDFYTKSVYGTDNMYIADPNIRNIIQTLTNSVTLFPRHMKALKSLGYTFTEVIAPKKA